MRFKIGDRVEIIKNIGNVAPGCEKYAGERGTITGRPEGIALYFCLGPGDWYELKMDCDPNDALYAKAHVLRKLDDGNELTKLVRWTDCPWQPNRETVSLSSAGI